MESLSLNYVSQLNEYQQTTQCTVEYEEGSTDGPSHNKTFTMRAIVNGQQYPEGTGKTKKEARINAAKNALDAIKNTQNTEPTTSSVQNTPNNMTVSQRNYICWLNEYSMKKKLCFKARESRKTGNTAQLYTYVCKYVCGDKEFPEACGNNKKDAKEAAAKCVYEELLKTQDVEVFDVNSNRTQRSEVVSRSASLDCASLSLADEPRCTTPDSNYIALLNDYSQKHKQALDFNLVERRGPPHKPEFVYKVVLDGKEYPEGQGKSAKEAKQHAAQRAWSVMNDNSGWTTQSSEDDSSSQTQDTSKSEDEQNSSISSSETPSSSSFIVFQDSSAVGSPMAESPCEIPKMDVKPKIKLAPVFHLSPIQPCLAKSKEVDPIVDAHSPTKPSEDQPSNQAVKSRFLEDFDSISRIGKGGFGRVFKARRKLEDTYYAVKIVKSKEKALREVGALAGFNNANIVRYYTAWVEDTTYRYDSSESYSHSDSGSDPVTKYLYIQMELCEGDTLYAWIGKMNSLNVDCPERRTDAAQIGRQVMKAVEYIHSKSFIHRDLKPLNIMFNSEGTVKIGDFGLVTTAENDNDTQLLERTKGTGTLIYMSPEQVALTPYDKKVDIYALGLIYFELIWKLATVSEKIWKNIRDRDFPPHFSSKFSFEHKLIDRMLSPRPEERPDASELIRELDRSSAVLKADPSDFVSGLSDSFDVIAKLGHGAYGCVYKVKHIYDDKIYAVKKVILTEKADSEVKALARLEHPNIVRYITCWPSSEDWTSNQEGNQESNTPGSSSDVETYEDDDDDDDDGDSDTSGVESLGVTDSGTYLFIQMEFCEGGTLTDWIKERNYLKKQRTMVEIHKIFYEIITGVEFIHANNLIHRDLKPDNILFGAEGKVKIGDFGLVAAQTDQNGDPIERSNRGTPTYMSPEQKNEKNYDVKTDIFPLGLVWFVMIWKISTGSERVKLWPDLRDRRFPEGFSDSYPTESKFIMKMLSNSPEHRPHAKDMKEKMEKFFSLDQNLLSQKTV
ncbi:interferon-induced, double-stranded RNA-activated protein kinase isoform X4 [Carassius gibelio]|uniref:interferon-induced, double-stranded RNA-activated protein kinase isoform X4 n=1 Tax=Carassius gibelio TaxID=101364 RepID=UPI002278A503|nr:interferon-induced, double-stranded RNA-activated protein kinase isoform X4 [Carassius gibelio]